MNNENSLQAISLDEMQAIEGGHQVSSCRYEVFLGAMGGAGVGGTLGGPLGASIGVSVGMIGVLALAPSCGPSTCAE